MASLSSIIKPLDSTFSGSKHPLLLQNNSVVWLVSGRRGAGKSSAVLSVLGDTRGFKGRFSKIWLISATARNDGKYDKLRTELEAEDQFYEQFTDETIEHIIQVTKDDLEEAREKKKRKLPKSLILLDDVITELSRSRTSPLNRLVTISRHLYMSIILISQRYNLIPTVIRSNADLISFWPTMNDKEYQTLESDVNLSREKFRYLYDKACDSPHAFLHCNLTAFPPVFYRIFTEIPINLLD